MGREYGSYIELGRQNICQLLRLIEDETLPVMERSFALDALAHVFDDTRALPVLFKYLEHPEPRLREGAVNGLVGYLHLPSLTSWLEKIAATDPDEEVRAAAELML